jgi:hypothetical protein
MRRLVAGLVVAAVGIAIVPAGGGAAAAKPFGAHVSCGAGG